MDKRIAGLLGAVAGLATIGTAQAAINPAAISDKLQVYSYADLLAPIAHPIALLKADEAARAQKPAAAPAADFQVAAAHHYHHHHYHRTYSRNYHHHHHYDHRRNIMTTAGTRSTVFPVWAVWSSTIGDSHPPAPASARRWCWASPARLSL